MTWRKKPEKPAFPPPCANRKIQAFRTVRNRTSNAVSGKTKRRPNGAGVLNCFCFRNSAQRSFVPRLSEQPFNLLHMMPSMNQMKLSPLRRSQRTQNRMVQHFSAPEASLALRDDLIHRRNLQPHLGSHLSPPANLAAQYCFGAFSSRRQVAKSQHHEARPRVSSRLEPLWVCPRPTTARILSPFRYRSDTDVPALPPRTTCRGDATSSARPTCLVPPTPEQASTLPSKESMPLSRVSARFR
jgi:hypothetical protein